MSNILSKGISNLVSASSKPGAKAAVKKAAVAYTKSRKAKIASENKAKKAEIKTASKAANVKKQDDTKKAKENARETRAVVAKDTKQHNKVEAREKKYAKPADNPYKGRKHIVETAHGPAVDLDAVERSGKKTSSTKVKVTKKN